MRVVVTGASGMLGGDVVSACVHRGHRVVPLSHAELDVTDGRAVDEALGAYGPDAVINCAAWTDVDGAETAEPAAMLINDTGAALVSAAAAAVGAKVLYP